MPDSTTFTGVVNKVPTLAHTPGGQPVCTFQLRVTRRWQDYTTHEWQEQNSLFDVVLWREMAENFVKSCDQGDIVLVTGRFEQEMVEINGESYTRIQMVADEIAPALRQQTARVTKNVRRDGGGSTTARPAPAQAAAQAPAAPKYVEEPL